MKNLRSFRCTVLVVVAVAISGRAHAQEGVDPSAVRPSSTTDPVAVTLIPQPASPAAFQYDPSVPLFANPRPGVFVPVTLPPAATAAAPPAGMPRNAFVAELRIGGGGFVTGSNGNGVLQPSLFIGARLAGRVHLGLGFGLQRVSLGEENANNQNDETETTTIFDIEPTASIDLVQALDRRVAFYLKLGVPLGALVQTDVARELVVGYDLALGVRYLPHAMFAIGLEGGVTGLYIHPTNDDGSSVTVIYGALVGTFFAGR